MAFEKRLRFRMSVVGALLLSIPTLAAAQLVLFDFESSDGDEASFSPSLVSDHLTVGDILRGNGLTASSATGTFSARSWSTGGLDPEDFYEFSIQPDVGYGLNLERIEFDERRSGSGIGTWTVRSSLDSFTFDLSPAPVSVPDNSETRLDQAISLDLPAFQDLTDSLVFRIYGYNAESSAGTWRVDNVELFGEVSVVPESESWLLSGFVGLLMVVILKRFRVPSVE